MFCTKPSGRVLVDIEIQENIGFYYWGCEPPERNCKYSYDVGASVVSRFNCYLCFRYESKEFSLFQLIFIVCFITVLSHHCPRLGRELSTYSPLTPTHILCACPKPAICNPVVGSYSFFGVCYN